MRILLLSPYLPHAHVGHGGGIATYHFARHLAAEHQVTLLCFRRYGELGLENDLASQGLRVETIPFRSERDRGAGRLLTVLDRMGVVFRAALRGIPWGVLKYDRESLRRRMLALVKELQPEVVILEHTQMASYGRVLQDRDVHVVLNTHEAGSLPRYRRAQAAAGTWSRWRAQRVLAEWQRWERRSLPWADTVTCVTEGDREWLAETTGYDHFRVMPMGVSVDDCPPVEVKPRGVPRLLFVGAFHHLPNRDALAVLVDQVMPALRATQPDVVLDVVGGDVPDGLRHRAAALGDCVRIHGFVPDLEPLYAATWLVVAPLFSGGGIKIKILEAAGRGCAVVTTPIGLEGIELRVDDPAEVYSAPSGDAFIAQLSQLIHRPTELPAVGSRARRAILARYDWTAIVKDFVADLSARINERPAP